MGACCIPANQRDELDMRDHQIQRGDQKGDKRTSQDKFADNAFKAQPTGKW